MKKFLAIVLSALMLTAGTALFAACSDEDGIDVYAPDGAPALALAQLMGEEMQFGSNKPVNYNVVNANTVQTYVTGENPQAELCVLPVNAAAMALHCVWATTSVRDAILKAVNLGDDTDTTGAVTGALAGLYYGYDAIPQEWRKLLVAREMIGSIANKMPCWRGDAR